MTPDLSVGTKLDGGKPRMDLIPPEALMALGEILAYGAKKYEDRNWEKGMEWGRLVGALLRHFTAWMAGEEEDPESGFPHLWHVLTNAAFLVAFEVREAGTDNRTPYTLADKELDDVKCGTPRLPDAMKDGPYDDDDGDDDDDDDGDDDDRDGVADVPSMAMSREFKRGLMEAQRSQF